LGKNKKLIVKDLCKVFGKNPKHALSLLAKGVDKDEIFKKTGMTIGVQNASFEVYEGEIFVIMGLSGSGKSTLVRLLNRLIEPTSGQIEVDGIDIANLNEKELINIRRKKLSMVFQSFALMPHMNIIDNVSFGLELSGINKELRYKAAREALDLVGLKSHEFSYPSELSGGMQQRIGLARALANNPDILLMDEAFSALDPLIRTEMQDELLVLQNDHQRTIVFISHDLDEAIRIGDRIAIMQDGQISQIGTPEEIISNPADAYVESFFRGVDVTSILSASHIINKNVPTLIKKDGFGVKSALKYMDDFDSDYGYYVEKNGTYIGVVTTDSLKNNASIMDAIVDTDYIEDTTSISELIGTVASSEYQTPVVDKNKKYKGSISKTRLLKTIDEGINNG